MLYGLRVGISGQAPQVVSKLKQENAALSGKLLEYDKLKRDNDALRSQFETESSVRYKLLPAKVLGFLGRSNDPSALIIDAGQRDGVKRGMAVVLENNLVGEISSVSEVYSKVLLPTDKEFSTIAKTAENQSLGIVHGEDNFILLDQVSIKDKIIEGETVLTRGEANNSGMPQVPSDLVVGKIESIYKNESQPFQTAKVISNVFVPKIETVFVVLGL
jgi:rod shape-determining protein MreC